MRAMSAKTGQSRAPLLATLPGLSRRRLIWLEVPMRTRAMNVPAPGETKTWVSFWWFSPRLKGKMSPAKRVNGNT